MKRFTISHNCNHVCHTAPRGDDLAIHAVHAYGHVLNESGRRHIEYTGPEFARIIAENYDASEPHNRAVIEHLKTI